MSITDRRDLLKHTVQLGGAALLAGPFAEMLLQGTESTNTKIKIGLCTYTWGQDWDLPTVIANCVKSKVLGVELRTLHKHGVEPSTGDEKRQEVKKRFADSPVVLVGLGTNECFHYEDTARVKKSVETTKTFIKLSHDCGGSGVKVKPNDLPKGVFRKKTTEQIGRALNDLGRFGADYGQQIRLEVHGGCSRLPIIKEIMDVADHPNVGVCWNSNDADLLDGGLQSNFQLVEKRLGATTHVRELDIGNYPYRQLITLLLRASYTGWLLLECRTMPKDGMAAMIHQREVFQRMLTDNR